MPVWTLQSRLSQDLYEPERPVPKMWTKTPAFHEDRSSVHLSRARIRCHSLGHYIDDATLTTIISTFIAKTAAVAVIKKKKKDRRKKMEREKKAAVLRLSSFAFFLVCSPQRETTLERNANDETWLVG